LPEFQIETSIFREEGKLRVLKKPLTPEAREHVACLYRNYQLLKNHYEKIKMTEAQFRDGDIIFEFVKGDNLDRLLVDAVFKREIKAFYNLLDRFVDSVKSYIPPTDGNTISDGCYSGVFENISGIDSDTHEYIANMDLNFDNIFIDENNRLELIDYEWIFNVRIPVNIIIFRSIEYFYGKYYEYIKDFISLKDLSDRYKITDAEIKIFRRMERRFQDYVMGRKHYYLINKNYKKHRVILRKNRFKLRDFIKRPKLLFDKSITPP
jgi:hypothetical protein